MAVLARLDSNARSEDLLAAVARDGAAVVENLIPPDQVARTLDEIMPYVEATRPGADAFSGFQTTRTGALVARSPACRELVMHPMVLESVRAFLKPWCERVQLHLSQVIRIRPGQTAQAMHRDKWAWGVHLAHLEPQLNTIWALSDFTAENGATRVAPGSVTWPDDRQPKDEEIVQATMPAGSVIVYSGSVFHSGGENRSRADRIGLNLTYTLGWLRQEENQYLSCPPEIARELDPELQHLIGYAMGSYALGYYTPPLPPGQGPEVITPAHALGGEGGDGGQLGSPELLEGLQADLGVVVDGSGS